MTRWILLTTSPIIFWGSGNNIFVFIEEGVGDDLFKLIWHEMSYTFRRTVCDQRDSRNTPDLLRKRKTNVLNRDPVEGSEYNRPSHCLFPPPIHLNVLAIIRCDDIATIGANAGEGFVFLEWMYYYYYWKMPKKLEGSGQLETLIGLYGKFQKQNTLLLIKRVVNQLRLEWTRPHLHFRGPTWLWVGEEVRMPCLLPADSI